jgi:hypothetical protein
MNGGIVFATHHQVFGPILSGNELGPYSSYINLDMRLVLSYIQFIEVANKGSKTHFVGLWRDEARSPRKYLLAETARTWSYGRRKTAG